MVTVHPSESAVPIVEAVRRVVLGLRVVSAGWLGALAIVAVLAGGLDATSGGAWFSPPRQVAAIVVLAIAWTVATAIAYSREKMAAWSFCLSDVAIAALVVILHADVVMEGRSFLGGYPFSSVVLVAAMRGAGSGLGAATVLAATTVVTAGATDAQVTASTVLIYVLGAAVVAWAALVIRRHDERQRSTEQLLAVERAERARADERAETGALLHDSVLQVLSLVQRNAADPVAVARLARGQERELRSWLSEEAREHGESVVAEIGQVGAEIEAQYPVEVEVVTSGDRRSDGPTQAVIAAMREAIVNAARHANVGQVSVFAQISAEGMEVFVRDRGVGFDPAAVPLDRRGVSESIVGRMERNGGSALLKSQESGGTEWTLTLPAVTRKNTDLAVGHKSDPAATTDQE